MMTRRLTALGFSLALGLSAFSPIHAQDGSIEALRAQMMEHTSGVMVVAHRACWQNAPENSIQAIEDCITLGIPVVEIDIRRTKDGVLVALHDNTLDRTTTASGDISDWMFDDVRQLRLKMGQGGPNAPLSDQIIPTFSEVMEAARGAILVNVDAKLDAYEQVFSELEALGLSDHVILKEEVTLENAERYMQADVFQSAFFMPKFTQGAGALSDLAQTLAPYHPIAVEIKFSDDTFFTEGTDDLTRLGARIWVSTLNGSPHKSAGRLDQYALSDPDKNWGEMVDMGATMIQTDQPERLRDYLERRADTRQP
ncbi:glycerophosphodiester phosphodiesterase family protein [Woodsholea maritima]|uniref:glycerophosphodiester phosphodiesterase family protein n=1 Tax=Woodsholea maritima TaxID=240237 RepID=UPI00037D6D63|nr:glycerophosphodiester phosphodiesterase family protein [Woodsholea maritima]